MKKYIYSQHDEKANFFNHPMISEVDPKAFTKNIERSIKLCRDPKLMSAIADCKLLLLGSFEDETGEFNILKVPQKLCDCDLLIESTGFVRGENEIN